MAERAAVAVGIGSERRRTSAGVPEGRLDVSMEPEPTDGTGAAAAAEAVAVAFFFARSFSRSRAAADRLALGAGIGVGDGTAAAAAAAAAATAAWPVGVEGGACTEWLELPAALSIGTDICRDGWMKGLTDTGRGGDADGEGDGDGEDDEEELGEGVGEGDAPGTAPGQHDTGPAGATAAAAACTWANLLSSSSLRALSFLIACILLLCSSSLRLWNCALFLLRAKISFSFCPTTSRRRASRGRETIPSLERYPPRLGRRSLYALSSISMAPSCGETQRGSEKRKRTRARVNRTGQGHGVIVMSMARAVGASST